MDQVRNEMYVNLHTLTHKMVELMWFFKPICYSAIQTLWYTLYEICDCIHPNMYT